MNARVKKASFVLTWTVMFAALFLNPCGAGSDPDDIEGSADNPYFSRMPNYYISESQDKEFDAYQFFDGNKLISIEGEKYRNAYYPKDGAQKASELQIRRNYTNALKSMGGTLIYEGTFKHPLINDPRSCCVNLTGRVIKGNKELWIEVVPHDYGSGVSYELTILEKEVMKQDVTASDMLAALNKEGFIALYINFDTGKADIKPESQAIVDQIVILLKDNPELNLNIEGHTDNVGDEKSNKALSEQRSKAVVDAIVKQGVDTKRLSSVGWGQEKPIADNRSEEGRAKNRRVEIVKK